MLSHVLNHNYFYYIYTNTIISLYKRIPHIHFLDTDIISKRALGIMILIKYHSFIPIYIFIEKVFFCVIGFLRLLFLRHVILTSSEYVGFPKIIHLSFGSVRRPHSDPTAIG